MKKILLVALNARYIHSSPAIYSLMMCCGENADKIELLEMTVNDREDRILAEIFKKKQLWNKNWMRTTETTVFPKLVEKALNLKLKIKNYHLL